MLTETLRVHQANYFSRSIAQYFERQHGVVTVNRAMANGFGSARLEQPAGQNVYLGYGAVQWRLLWT